MPSLTHEERLVMQAAVIQANLPLSELAKQLGMRQAAVRRKLQALYEKKVLVGKMACINCLALGFSEFFLFLSVGGGTEEERQKFVKLMVEHEQVALVAEFGGDYQYEVRMYARSAVEVHEFLGMLAAHCKLKIRTPEVEVMHEEEYSGVQYEKTSAPAAPPLRYGPVERCVSIDETDHKILYLLANGECESHSEAARVLKLPARTITHRISRLESKGVIFGYYHVVDGKAVGDGPISLLVATAALAPQRHQDFLRYCREHPCVAYVNTLLGAWNLRIFLRVRDLKQVMELIHELYAKFPNEMQDTRVMPQLNFYKCTMYPFRNFKIARQPAPPN